MEESQMQWRTSTRFHGFASLGGDSSILHPHPFLWHSSFHQGENRQVNLHILPSVPPNHFFLFWSCCDHKKHVRLICYFFFRYGPVFRTSFFFFDPVFRTSLVGQHVIITTDPEFSYFVFQEEGKLFQRRYPDTFVEIFRKQNMGALHGIIHKCLKNMALSLFSPKSLKTMLSEGSM